MSEITLPSASKITATGLSVSDACASAGSTAPEPAGMFAVVLLPFTSSLNEPPAVTETAAVFTLDQTAAAPATSEAAWLFDTVEESAP